MTEPHPTNLTVRIGGLMRCCIKTLQEAMVRDEEGEVLPCKWCSSKMIVRDGKWEWVWKKPNETSLDIDRR